MSVETTAARSLTTRINTVIGRCVPSRAKAASIYYSLGEERLLDLLAAVRCSAWSVPPAASSRHTAVFARARGLRVPGLGRPGGPIN